MRDMTPEEIEALNAGITNAKSESFRKSDLPQGDAR